MKGLPGWFPLLAVTVAIGVLSVVPPPELPTSEFEFGDKINHCVAMMVVVLTVVRATRWRRKRRNRQHEFTMGAIYTLALGLAIEIVQGWIPNRSSDLLDLLADAVGIVVGILVGALLDATPLGRLLFGPPTRRAGTPAANE